MRMNQLQISGIMLKRYKNHVMKQLGFKSQKEVIEFARKNITNSPQALAPLAPVTCARKS